MERLSEQGIVKTTDDHTGQPTGGRAQREVLHCCADLDVHVPASSSHGRLVSEVTHHVANICAQCDRHGRGRNPGLVPDRRGRQAWTHVVRGSRKQHPILVVPRPGACGFWTPGDDEVQRGASCC